MHPMPKEYEDKVSVLLKVLQEQVNYNIIISLLCTQTNLNFFRFAKMAPG